MHTIYPVKQPTTQLAYHPTSLPPNQPTTQLAYHPTSLLALMKNVHNLAIFQSICLKLGMSTQNGKTPHMYLIYKHLSMLIGQTSLPLNQPNFDGF